MAWESNAADASSAARPRQSSSAAGHHRALSLQQKTSVGTAADPSRAAQQAHSSHVADAFLQPFLDPGFDPAAYWNRAFATASTTPAPASASASASTPAPTPTEGELARQAQAAQATLSQIGAHTTRLTGVLTQLTDDILRSGGRLAYEVELLRGETIGLSEVVTAAAEEVAAELPTETEAVKEGGEGEEEEEKAEAGPREGDEHTGETDTTRAPAAAAAAAPANPPPPALAQLRMLAQVRSRLDAVIHTFGDAMEFVMPPSALSMTASFLSVSGPGQAGGDGSGSSNGGGGGGGANGAQNGGATTEEKGQQVMRARREEIARLLAAAAGPAAPEIEAATARVAALRTLCRVWAGTPEEKARVRFVEGLQRLVDDRVRDLERAAAREEERARERMRERGEEAARQTGSSAGAAGAAAGGSSGTAAQQQQDGSGAGASGSRGYAAAGYGFITQLQKIRSGL